MSLQRMRVDGTENRPVYVVQRVDQVHELSEVSEGG